MEQFIPVPAFVYNNRSLKAQAVTKQELPKDSAEQNPTYPIDSPEKETKNKKLFAETDPLVGKKLSCPRIKLSNSQTIIFDGVEPGVLLSKFAQALLRKKADVPDIYFPSFDAAGISPILVLNQSAKAAKRGSYVHFKK